ncbi:glycosyltransferase family 9 protein [Reichenbachiella ulvae]|uniref:Glycosyltransferase family 9 (Heptosyltransferase) n=1 Tax=Reichenbachiella ulvae TaxID=2980104 RepID=A0ABT3D100_9BACT|nr:glycosyltransferase family 9 protein [Reichenbachiella ulvae]MCV9389504.1 hypothetical protein [Reichenbachiella ulvae]
MNYPNAEIFAWSPVEEALFFEDIQVLDKVNLVKNKKIQGLIEIRKWKPDILINMRPASEFAHLITLCSNSSVKIGYETKSLFKYFYTFLVTKSHGYIAFRYLNLLRPLKIPIKFNFDAIRKFEGNTSLPHKKSFICLIPVGGEGEHKRWGIENFCRMCQLISQYSPSLHYVFLLGRKESGYVRIIDKMLGKNASTYINANIYEIVKIVSNARVTISNDCGPGHLAQMCEVNYIGLWGWKEDESPFVRMKEWFFSRPNAISILPHEEQKDIKTISPNDVANIAIQFCR